MGCQGVKYNARQEAKYVKPTIAVMSFENRAPAHMKWQLGDALADQLIDRLLHTNRYVVLERQQLRSIMAELRRGNDRRFRQTGRPKPGYLKHVQYLVKGTITDFGHVATVEGAWKLLDWGIFGSSSYAIVAATLYVVEVQSGQVVASSSVEAKIRDSEAGAKGKYDDMAFGGYTFYHTPIGRATSKMLDKAVNEIADAIAERQFQPKIASLINNQIVISGGRNRRIKVGDEYEVRTTSQQVFDPDSGDILGHIVGESTGRVRVLQVTEKYSIAKPLSGNQYEVGQALFKVDPKRAKTPAMVSSY